MALTVYFGHPCFFDLTTPCTAQEAPIAHLAERTGTTDGAWCPSEMVDKYRRKVALLTLS